MSEQERDDDAASQQSSKPHQSMSHELAFPDLKEGKAWGESISKRRADELEAMLQKWNAEHEHGGRNGPFDAEGSDFRLTGADVF